ncbi:MAG: hypothetical protein JST73_07960, partial [Actinobacteria bacterium]|nr:hypothetical protein [Actinomycetota bacterium]
MTALAIANLAILALVVVLVFGLLRSHAAILRRLHELESDGIVRDDPGPAPVRLEDPFAPARRVVGETLDHEQAVFAVSGVDHDTILVFLSSGCLTCQGFWAAFAGDGVTLPPRTRIVIVAKDLSEESPAKLAELAPRGIDLVCSSTAWTDYQVPGSPYVIAINGANGKIQGEGTGMSWDQVAGLLAQATGDRTYVVGDAAKHVPKPRSDV